MKKLLSVLALFCLSLPLIAQVNKDVEVTRTYDPAVMDAQKIWYEPSTTVGDSSAVKDGFSYSIFPKSSPGNFGLTPISSAKIVNNAQDESGLGYIRAGIGYQISPLLDFYISNKNTETALVGFYANHRSFWGKTKLEGHGDPKMKSDYMNNDLGLFTKLFLDGSTVTLNADYSRRDLRLYGFDPIVFDGYYNKGDIESNNKRAYNLFNINALWKSDAEAGEVFYSFGASYQLFNGKDKYDGAQTMKENAFALSGSLGAQLMDETQTISLAARAALYNRNDALDACGNNILLSATPSWAYADDYWNVKLGMQIVMDSYNSSTKFRFYPAVAVSYKIHEYFTPMVEVKGETEVNNFRKLAYENPYIGFPVITASSLSPISFKNTNHKLIGIFSVKGDIEAFSYNAFVSYSKIDYLPLYTNVPVALAGGAITHADSNTFFTNYADGSKTSLGAELSYNDDVLSLYAKAVYNSYSVKLAGYKLDHAWHKPAVETNLTARYKVSDNLVLTADLRALFGRYAYNTNLMQDRKLKNVWDLGFGAEVLITSKFSVFANIANILNQKYDIYSRYIVPGTICSAGVTYRF